MKFDGKTTDAIVESIDIFPTVCELAEIAKPESLNGTSLLPQISDAAALGRYAVSYSPGDSTIRTKTHRLISHKGGAVELYDHTSPEGETKNLAASEPELVSELKAKLAERLGK
jgi:iduronate 2-sulfatase